MRMVTGRPWGQYFTSPRSTASATGTHSRASEAFPAFTAALQAMVARVSSRMPRLPGFFPSRRASASSERREAASSGAKSEGSCRTSSAPSPKSSASTPSSESRGRFSSRIARSSASGLQRAGERSIWLTVSKDRFFSLSKSMRSWAACLSMKMISSPDSTRMYSEKASPNMR